MSGIHLSSHLPLAAAAVLRLIGYNAEVLVGNTDTDLKSPMDWP